MRVVFMGTGEIALPTLRWLLTPEAGCEVAGIFTQPDKKIGRKQVVVPPEVKQIGLAAGVEVLQPLSLRKDPEAIERLRTWAPDLLVVMAYGQILPRSVIEIPRLASINLHASLLPRHRGASPIQAAIREGDVESGITLMHIVPQLDAGDMILKETTPILETDTGGSLHDRLAEIGPSLLVRGIPLFRKGNVLSEPQDEALVTYSGKLEREDGQIDWTRDAAAIERLIRAYDPWPGTYTTTTGGEGTKKLKIFPIATVSDRAEAKPGTVLASDGQLVVACGKGSLILSGDLQLEGRKRLPAAEFLRGTDLPEGSVLGDG